jgi:hypothetical protein
LGKKGYYQDRGGPGDCYHCGGREGGEGSRSMGRGEHGMGRGGGQPRDCITGVGIMVLRTMLEVVEFAGVVRDCCFEVAEYGIRKNDI